MLRLLLDEGISPAVAMGLRRRCHGMEVFAMAEWEGGNFVGLPDSVCLREAAVHELTLVTYDRGAISPVLKEWMEEGITHGGVIFVDEKTISPAETGQLVSALAGLAKEPGDWEWTNRISFLRDRCDTAFPITSKLQNRKRSLPDLRRRWPDNSR
jgi:hypothetical protein